jgi:tetratricopeptide (TPR) repeat protein
MLPICVRVIQTSTQDTLLLGMAAKDWFRNEHWDSEIETRFFDKLRRAKDKAQYLKIQAGHLTETHPTVALDLIDKYFALQQHLFDAEAYLQQAQAYRALGRERDAIDCYRKALQREREFPNLRTQAWSEFGLLVATEEKLDLFDEVLSALEEHKRDVMFPTQEFLWYGIYALIANAVSQPELAKDYAVKALSAAGRSHSGFRYHPKAGLVEGQFPDVRQRLQRLAAR